MKQHPPVLFLDIDGVLNRCAFSAQGLETDKCDLLADLCHETGCKIVVSSTWRKYPLSMERLRWMFADRGIECLGVTPDLTSEPGDGKLISVAVARWVEIREWLTQHSAVKQYAIVDDDPDADDGAGRYVKTGSSEGLTERHIERLKEILINRPPLEGA